MEILLAYIILFESGVIKKDEYIKVLDNLFKKNPDDELLLELEWSTSDMAHSYFLIYSYFYYDGNKFNYDLFGEYLLNRLEKLYLDKNIDIYKFNQKAYELWTNIPEIVKYDEPFYSLRYADDLLSWGDEIKAIKVYENLFKF